MSARSSMLANTSEASVVPKIFSCLYGDRATTLTSVLHDFGLSTVQVEACGLRHELTEQFVVVPRHNPPGQQTVGVLSSGAVASYEQFCSAVTTFIRGHFKGDVFTPFWHRHGCFGRLLFERPNFRMLYDLLGPHCASALLFGYYVFERAGMDTYIQWTGPPASSIKTSRAGSNDDKTTGVTAFMAKSPAYTLHPSAKGSKPDHRAASSTTPPGAGCAVKAASSLRESPAGVQFARLRTLKKRRTRRVKPAVMAREPKPDDDHKVYARSMLYVVNPKRVEKQFMLGSPSNLHSAKQLADRVFRPSSDCPIQVRHHVSLLRALRQLLKNHRSCRYRSLCMEHCAHSGPQNGGRGSSYDDHDVLLLSPLSELVTNRVPLRADSRFLHAALRKLIPVDLFGSSNNWRKVVTRLASVAKMRKDEAVIMSQFVDELNANHVPWLCGQVGNEKVRWLRILVTWCMRLAAAIVSIYFYVTDSRKGKRQLLFYRRPVWNILVKVWASGEDILQLVEPSRKAPRIKGLGRLLPKGDAGGVRLLVKALIPKDAEAKFRTLKVFLDSLKDGGGGLDRLYSIWKAFVGSWKERGKPEVFFVKADIENCFHSVDHKVALEVVSRAFELSEKDAKIVACTEVKLGKYGCVMRHWRQLFARDIASMTYLPGRETVVNHDGGCETARIIVAKMCILPNSKELQKLLRDYLIDFHVRLHGTTYSLRKGVLQGGMLSADIADAYMAELQRRHLASFGKVPGELLVRATDDFLYVTSDRESARRFLDTFARGFPDFGLVASPSKVHTNVVSEPRGHFDLLTSSCVTQRATFCGYVFDMRTMEVFREPMASLPVESVVGKPDRQPGEALKNYLSPWHLPICSLALDPEINSRDCVIAGLLDCFVAFADRFFYSVNDMRYVDDRYVIKVLHGVLDNFLVRIFRWASKVGVALPLCAVELRYLFLEVSSRKADRKAMIVGKRIQEPLKKVRMELASTGDVKALKAFVDLVLS